MRKPLTISSVVASGLLLLLLLLLTLGGGLSAQTIIGGTNGNPSAVLELQSNSQGLLLPRLTTAERTAIVNPAEGLLIYNTSLECVEINLGSSSSPDWFCLLAITGRIASLDCASSTHTGGLTVGLAAEGVSSSIPYTGGNGRFYNRQMVSSTGVTGLTATLTAGAFTNGSGMVTYTITGTPSGTGTASFALNIGGRSCTLSRTVSLPAGVISSLDCGGATNNGSLVSGQSASGVSSVVPYTGGNGGTYSGQTVSSTGVTGLTATLAAGTLSSGSGSLTYTITGTPSGSGTASFALSIGGRSCTLSRTVSLPAGVISSLNCGGATNNGSLVSGQSASGVSSVVPYTGGNGGTYSGQTVSSTGVTGLTATLAAGTLASGSGSLTYTITGTPSGGGTASFALNIGGQTCTLQLTVSFACGAFVASGVWKQFMCHNLGANTSADPFTPSWELIGNYYQWGRNPTCFGRDGMDSANPCSSPIYGAAGPWGNITNNDNAGTITGWSTTAAANGAWVDGSKTVNDPCPAGWRVPTAAQLTNLANNTLNPRTSVGTWSSNSTNYSVGYRFGQSLFLPAAGYRGNSLGSLGDRGSFGYYWSSTESSSNAQYLNFGSSGADMFTFYRASGFSLRCVAE